MHQTWISYDSTCTLPFQIQGNKLNKQNHELWTNTFHQLKSEILILNLQWIKCTSIQFITSWYHRWSLHKASLITYFLAILCTRIYKYWLEYIYTHIATHMQIERDVSIALELLLYDVPHYASDCLKICRQLVYRKCMQQLVRWGDWI